jgi:hypothetical protein
MFNGFINHVSLRAGLVLAAAVLGCGSATAGEVPDPETLIARSIAYHDPAGVWGTGRVELDLVTTYSDDLAGRVGGTTATVQLLLAPSVHRFRYVKTVGEDVVDYRLSAEDTAVVVNGSDTVTEADRKRLRLRDPVMYRDYFEYLFGMPMKLRDPGTILDPQVREEKFAGVDVWSVRVTYSPDVGEDIWYFYFDRNTFALRGYRFYHDETRNDGEYITFAGEIGDKTTELKLPRTRSWYYNEGDEFLATDEIVAIRAHISP